ncbi:MAG TPA: hypothetical protein VFB15_13605 [Candidatus Binataceae bacterium]|jgi:hypothetical protein|nr:hypothetical protein [Candidatus Binataceae bacterium]
MHLLAGLFAVLVGMSGTKPPARQMPVAQCKALHYYGVAVVGTQACFFGGSSGTPFTGVRGISSAIPVSGPAPHLAGVP